MMRFLGSLAIAIPAIILTARPIPAREPAASDTLSLSLEESVSLALKNNAEIKVAEEKVTEARSRLAEAGTAFLPRVTGSAGYTRLDTAPYIPTSRLAGIFAGGTGTPSLSSLPDKIPIGLEDNYAASLKLVQPLWSGGRITDAYEMSRFAAEKAASDAERTRVELVFETKRAYLGCVKALRLETVAAQSVSRLEAHLADVQAMYEAGTAAKNDVLKTEVYLSQARLALLRARHVARLGEKSLSSLLELPFDSEISFTTAVEEITPERIDLDSAVATAIERRAELASLGLQRRIAGTDVAMKRSGYLPDVSLFANLAYQYPDREYAKDFYASWSVGVTAQMNVFDWGAVAHRARESKSRLRQVELAERSARDAVTLDVTRAHLALVEAWDETEVAHTGVAQAEENYRVTEERFAEGLATNTDLLDAEVLRTSALAAHGNAMVDYVIARADLDRAMGLSTP